MPASLELVLDLSELDPHPLRDRDALEHEPPGLGLRADVREPQEPERLRLPDSPRRSPLDREAAELDETRLVGMQLQGKLREPLTKIAEELPGVTLMLEPGHEVVGEPHEDDIPAGLSTPPLPGP